jgi:hypothetical protein
MEAKNKNKVEHQKLMVLTISRKYVQLIHAMWMERDRVERERRVFKVNKDKDGNIRYYLIQSNRRHYMVYIYPTGFCMYTGRNKKWFSGKRFAITPTHLIVKGVKMPINQVIYNGVDVIDYLSKKL